jgi:hypothetical protein
MARIALVPWFGPEAGDAPPLLVGIELELQADGVLDAADETHARVRFSFHDVFSGRYGISICCLNHSIEIGFGQTPPGAGAEGVSNNKQHFSTIYMILT